MLFIKNQTKNILALYIAYCVYVDLYKFKEQSQENGTLSFVIIHVTNSASS